tara:strand:+ start:6373 stop:6591 length:219 start_codon:yes stop_codon:yes gene_type:complete
MAKILDINTGKEKETEYFNCSLCNCKFSEEEGGLIKGLIGIMLVFFCPTCFSGLLDMADYFRGRNDDEEEEE